MLFFKKENSLNLLLTIHHLVIVKQKRKLRIVNKNEGKRERKRREGGREGGSIGMGNSVSK